MFIVNLEVTALDKYSSGYSFNEYFSKVGHTVTSTFVNQDDIKWKNPATIYSFELLTIDEESVVSDLLTLNADSNNDVLQLDPKLLRLASPLISESLTHLFDLSLMSRVISSDWKLARITPIHKGKGSSNAEANYCRISVLSHVVKILEKQVHKQLIEYLEAPAFITPYQSAYLKKHSTVTCLHRVGDDLCENIDDYDLCVVFFLDIEKCFDSINNKILLQNSITTKLPRSYHYTNNWRRI